jgi:hypothetical protein
MAFTSRPRTETLFRIYFGLLAIGIVLCGVLTDRYFARHGDSSMTPDVVAAQRDTKSRAPGPTINWGGQKR